MNRKSKALGLALLAALVMGAIGAQGASGDLFVSEVKDTVLTSEVHVQIQLTYGGSTVTCGITKFTGTATSTEETEITVTPTWDECVIAGTPLVVRTNHCGYLFTSHTVAHEENPEETHAPVHIECENEGEAIEAEIPAFGHCNLTTGPQTSTKGVTYTDGKQENSEKEEVTVRVTAEMSVTRDNPNSNFFCMLLPESGIATVTGAVFIKGYEYMSGPSKEFTEDSTALTEDRGTTHWSWVEGEQVNIGADTG